MSDKINKCGCGGEPTCYGIDKFFMRCKSCNTETAVFPTREKTLDAWNTAHPEISNAQQAYEWLKTGKIINNGAKYRLKEGVLQRMSIYGDWEEYTISIKTLFESKWEIYEEPKYKEITAEEALIYFALNGKNEKIVVLYNNDQEYYIVELASKVVCFSNKNKVGFTMHRGHLKNLKWLCYEK